MKKRFTIGGAIVGFLHGVSIMVYVFIKGPGHPGIFELMFQTAVVGILVVIGSLLGLLIGWLVSLCLPKKR